MFEKFTERARQVVVLAQEEARTLKHNYIGTEHILIGLLREEEGLAARALDNFDITTERVRAQVVRIVGVGEESTNGQIPFTPRTKKIIELALREALFLGHNYVSTEHVLLGLIRENEGVGMRILGNLMADTKEERYQVTEKIRNEVIRMLSGPGGRKWDKELEKVEKVETYEWDVFQGGARIAAYANKPLIEAGDGVVSISGVEDEPIIIVMPLNAIKITRRKKVE
jgi:ATP-dependent Clp protease ATP-binding subunit ClpA